MENKSLPITIKGRDIGSSRDLKSGLPIHLTNGKPAPLVSQGESCRSDIAVTPAGWDDIGRILQELGYSCQTISQDQLCDLKLLRHFRTVFINCSNIRLASQSQAGRTLREYVAGGGSLYASDFAAYYVHEAFPELFSYQHGGSKGKVIATVVDRGLQALMGRTIELIFDIGDWRMPSSLSSDCRSYVIAGTTPVVISFRCGRGQVVFTSFHNRAQPTESERKLLSFLVLKPMAATASLDISGVGRRALEQLQEIPGLAKEGGKIYWYRYKVSDSSAASLMFMVTWGPGTAEFRLSVWRPDGQLFKTVQNSAPPCIIGVPQAEAGVWKYEVVPVRVPYPQFVYVTSAAPQELITKALPSGMK
jgi:hypothetical protein